MILDKRLSGHLKFNLQAIPVLLAALVFWAIIGGWYVAVAPPNMAGTDNIGVVLSVFGFCLFLADRIAVIWLGVYSRVLVIPTWIWGLVFVVWGLGEWLHSFSRRYLAIFIIHWLVLLLLIALASFLSGRRRRQAEYSAGR
jgi:hypothetical protein